MQSHSSKSMGFISPCVDPLQGSLSLTRDRSTRFPPFRLNSSEVSGSQHTYTQVLSWQKSSCQSQWHHKLGNFFKNFKKDRYMEHCIPFIYTQAYKWMGKEKKNSVVLKVQRFRKHLLKTLFALSTKEQQATKWDCSQFSCNPESMQPCS